MIIETAERKIGAPGEKRRNLVPLLLNKIRVSGSRTNPINLKAPPLSLTLYCDSNTSRTQGAFFTPNAA